MLLQEVQRQCQRIHPPRRQASPYHRVVAIFLIKTFSRGSIVVRITAFLLCNVVVIAIYWGLPPGLLVLESASSLQVPPHEVVRHGL